jgi:hypothetical protein
VGLYAPSAEAQVVHAVASCAVDLGWAASRIFDTVGVPAFRVLSAPMLIDSYQLENAVLKSTMPARMLAGLSRVHVTGLAVLGDALGLESPPLGVGAAGAIVSSLHGDPPGVCGDRDLPGRCRGVLGHVRQRLGADEVHARRHGRRGCGHCDGQVHVEREVVRERGERRPQPLPPHGWR